MRKIWFAVSIVLLSMMTVQVPAIAPRLRLLTQLFQERIPATAISSAFNLTFALSGHDPGSDGLELRYSATGYNNNQLGILGFNETEYVAFIRAGGSDVAIAQVFTGKLESRFSSDCYLPNSGQICAGMITVRLTEVKVILVPVAGIPHIIPSSCVPQSACPPVTIWARHSWTVTTIG